MKNDIILVKDIPINVTNFNNEDYICISDIAKAKIGNSGVKDVVRNWLRNRNTLQFLGTWEKLYTEHFKGVEFDSFKSINLDLYEGLLLINLVYIYRRMIK